jgi:hypothetical protein
MEGEKIHVAWDTLVDTFATGRENPDYDVYLRTRTGGSWGPAVAVDRREGIQAAPALVAAPGRGVLVAYHSSHRHGLVKWWNLRRVLDGSVEELAARDTYSERPPEGEQQGAEFPAVAVAGDRVVVLSRPSQGAYLQVVDASGISAPLDLTRRGWGARGMSADVSFAGDGSLVAVRRARHGCVLERFTFDSTSTRPPVFTAVADAGKPQVARTSLPALSPSGDDLRVFFGDLHMHSAMTDGTGPPDEILARAWIRGLHFAALTDHGSIVGSRLLPSMFDEIAWVTEAFHAREDFTTLHAYEWTAPACPKGFGHRNVYFSGLPPSRICTYRDRCPDTRRLLAFARKTGAIVVPHHTSWTGTDWDNADKRVQRLFEIVSTHGASEHLDNQPIPHRGRMKGMFALDGLRKGLLFGFVGGSDAHGLLYHHGVGRRLNPWRTGLTGVSAPSNRRADIFKGLFERRTLATSGAIMHVFIDVNGLRMGQEGRIQAPPVVRIKVFGTLPLGKVEVLRDGEVVHTVKPRGKGAEDRWQDVGVEPGMHTYYLRVVQGTGDDIDVAWSSPVFVEVAGRSR